MSSYLSFRVLDMEQLSKNHKHRNSGAYLKDIVYGANDGIITTFAIVAGVAGASLDSTVVILLGLANLFADGFSMAASNYLGSKSERDYVVQERRTEELELYHTPDIEHAEMFGFLQRRGYIKEDANMLLALLSKNKEFWLDIMTREELGIGPPEKTDKPLRSAAATFFSFVIAGSVPLIPYFFTMQGSLFGLAIIATAASLFGIGALRSLITNQRWYIAGFEMLAIGGIAACIAYGIGYVVSGLAE